MCHNFLVNRRCTDKTLMYEQIIHLFYPSQNRDERLDKEKKYIYIALKKKKMNAILSEKRK